MPLIETGEAPGAFNSWNKMRGSNFNKLRLFGIQAVKSRYSRDFGGCQAVGRVHGKDDNVPILHQVGCFGQGSVKAPGLLHAVGRASPCRKMTHSARPILAITKFSGSLT